MDEYLGRTQNAGAIATMKEDILALRRDVEAQRILIDTLREEIKTLE